MTEEQEKKFDALMAKFDLIPPENLDMPCNDELRKEIIEFLEKTLKINNEYIQRLINL